MLGLPNERLFLPSHSEAYAIDSDLYEERILSRIQRARKRQNDELPVWIELATDLSPEREEPALGYFSPIGGRLEAASDGTRTWRAMGRGNLNANVGLVQRFLSQVVGGMESATRIERATSHRFGPETCPTDSYEGDQPPWIIHTKRTHPLGIPSGRWFNFLFWSRRLGSNQRPVVYES